MKIKNNSLPFAIEDKKCTGCMACLAVCPCDAISAVENEEGFLFPICDTAKCIQCNLCHKICPSCNETKSFSILHSVSKAVLLKDKKALRNSASGGAFYGIALFFIEKKRGYVFGAAYDDKFSVKHIKISNVWELNKLQNSKYVQSNTISAYKEVKSLLDKQENVLYSGTPCQVAGLKNFLREDYDNLWTIDILCHGVPSQKLLKKEIEFINAQNKKKYNAIKFRCRGSHTKSFYYLCCQQSNGKRVFMNERQSLYYKLFFMSASLRESCYCCSYSNINRVGDFSIGDSSSSDFYLNFYPNESCSSLFINSPKAKAYWFDGISELFDYCKLNVKKEIELNHPLRKSAERPILRDEVYKMIYKEGYSKVYKNYCEPMGIQSELRIKKNLAIPSIAIYLKSLSRKEGVLGEIIKRLISVYHRIIGRTS